MSQFFDDLICNPVTWIVGIIVLVGGVFWLENSELNSFRKRCIAAGETPAKCELLVEIKSSADSAAISAGFAVGMSSGRR
jgi:hypothetical protein